MRIKSVVALMCIGLMLTVYILHAMVTRIKLCSVDSDGQWDAMIFMEIGDSFFWMHVTPRQGLDGQINSTFIAIRKVARF